MINIKYVGTDTMIPVTFERNSDHVVTLRGTTEVNTSGFETYRMDGETLLGVWNGYTTVYRLGDDYVQYSDDGSVWVEPEPQPEPEPDPTPSLEERINDLEIAICEIADAPGAME